jgi:hypothetical protein
VYFLLAMCLFPRPGYLGVWGKLTAELGGLGLAWKASPFPDCGNCIPLSRYLRFQELVADLLRRPVPVR